MRVLYLLFFILCVSTSAFADGKEHYTIDEYLSMHPEQKELSAAFTQAVSEAGEPIKHRMTHAVKVAVIYPAIQQSNYWRDSVRSMERRLDELGIKYELYKYYSKPSGDYRLQVMQLTEAAKNGVEYIALSVDNSSLQRLIPSLVSSGKSKIIIQNLTTPLRSWEGNQPFLYVGFDHIEGAKILAEYYSNLFPKGGKYLMLYGTKGTVSSQRGGGFENYARSKGLIPVAKYYTDFNADTAYNAAKQALESHEDLSFIYACSTDIAIGASRAVSEAGLNGKVLVNGWGGTVKELNLIKDKKLDFTVMRMNDDNGVAIAEAIKSDLSGRGEKVPQIFSGEFVTVTKEMDWQEIQTLEERALRYSGK